jgi:molybdopterin adenylyltransferase
MSKVTIGILTVSDRAFNGEYEDLGGPAIEKWLSENICTPYQVEYTIVPDELDQISNQLINWSDQNFALVLTTGGTGPAPRDVTPEATLAVADKIMDGFGERMRQISLKYVPTAILSRQTGVIRKKTVIINLPGQPKSIKETLDELFEAVPYCIELVSGLFVDTYPEKIKAFRPLKK